MRWSISLNLPFLCDMIVETMTPEEVVREAKRDLPAMWNKMRGPLQRYLRLAKVDKACRDREFVEPYRSVNGNNWLVAIRPWKKGVAVVPFVWYRGKDGKLRAARIIEGGVSIHFSAHMFDQYFARFNKLGDALDRLKEFARENMDTGVEYCDEIGELRVGVKHGYLLGVWVVKHDIAQVNTFVDHGRLFPEQLEQMDRLDEQRLESIRPHAHSTAVRNVRLHGPGAVGRRAA